MLADDNLAAFQLSSAFDKATTQKAINASRPRGGAASASRENNPDTEVGHWGEGNTKKKKAQGAKGGDNVYNTNH